MSIIDSQLFLHATPYMSKKILDHRTYLSVPEIFHLFGGFGDPQGVMRGVMGKIAYNLGCLVVFVHDEPQTVRKPENRLGDFTCVMLSWYVKYLKAPK